MADESLNMNAIFTSLTKEDIKLKEQQDILNSLIEYARKHDSKIEKPESGFDSEAELRRAIAAGVSDAFESAGAGISTIWKTSLNLFGYFEDLEGAKNKQRTGYYRQFLDADSNVAASLGAGVKAAIVEGYALAEKRNGHTDEMARGMADEWAAAIDLKTANDALIEHRSKYEGALKRRGDAVETINSGEGDVEKAKTAKQAAEKELDALDDDISSGVIRLHQAQAASILATLRRRIAEADEKERKEAEEKARKEADDESPEGSEKKARRKHGRKTRKVSYETDSEVYAGSDEAGQIEYAVLRIGDEPDSEGPFRGLVSKAGNGAAAAGTGGAHAAMSLGPAESANTVSDAVEKQRDAVNRLTESEKENQLQSQLTAGANQALGFASEKAMGLVEKAFGAALDSVLLYSHAQEQAQAASHKTQAQQVAEAEAAAQVALAGIAKEAAIKALFQVAEGVAAAATPGMQASAAGHFVSAGIFASIAAVTGGGAIAIGQTRGNTEAEDKQLASAQGGGAGSGPTVAAPGAGGFGSGGSKVINVYFTSGGALLATSSDLEKSLRKATSYAARLGP